jgi:acyl-CoA synthetase (AMP-forming)/AMP-acid ligase II
VSLFSVVLEGGPAPSTKHATLVDALVTAARFDLEEAGLGYIGRDGESWASYGALLDRAAHLARALLDRGIRPGDRVALIAPTSPAFVEAFFGTVLAGAVAVPLYPPVRLGRLDEYHRSTARMLGTVGARIVLADGLVRRLLGRAIEDARPTLGCITIEELAHDPWRSRPLPRVEQDDLALIQFSSGSTVDPKPVALSHGNLLAQCAALESFFPTHAPDGTLLRGRTGVSWLPLYHDMGLIGSLLLAVYAPGRLALIPPELFLARPALWLQTIARHRALVSPAPNFAYAYAEKRIRDDELAGVDLSSWRFALNGAEPIAPKVMKRFAERFSRHGFDPAAMKPVYGLAEASLAVTFPRSTDGARDLPHGGRPIVSVGAPIPGVTVRVDAESHRAVGRIHVRGPSVMREYFARPGETARTVVDGWLDTGDLGFVDDGELFVCGRAKDVIIVRGANHAPQAFEDPLDEVDGVRAGCAVAVGWVPPGGDGESVVLLVERSSETTGDATGDLEDRIRAAVLERTGVRPDVVRVLPPGTLPRTSSGKLRRGEALKRFAEGKLDPPAAVTRLHIAKELVRSTLAFARTRLSTRDDEL